MSKKAISVKFVEGTDNELEILLVPYGGLFKGRTTDGCDLDGEHFTKNTNLCLDFFPDSRPLLYDHGHDPAVEVDVVGRLDSKSIREDEKGHWFRAQLDKSSQYFEAICDLVEKGKLFASSGALGHLVQVAKSGEILRWPLIEGSLTPTPSNLLASVGFAEADKHFKSAGLALANPDMKATLEKALAESETDDDLKSQIKVLMESVDTSGGFLVPEQTATTETIQKKATPTADDDDDDAKDDDEDGDGKEKPKTGKTPTDLAAVLKFVVDHPEQTAEFVAQQGEPNTVPDETYKNAVTLSYDGQLLLLLPQGEAAKMADFSKAVKDGEFILRSGYDAPEGSAEDWLCDLRRLLNRGLIAVPFEYSGYVDVIATWGVNSAGHCLVSVGSYDSGDYDVAFYDVTFDVGADGEPVLTGATPYASVYMPLDQVPATTLGRDDDGMEKSMLPFKMHGDFMILAAKSFGHRTEGLARERSKEGRILSSSNRERLGKFLDQWKTVGADLQALFDSTAPKAKADPSLLRRQTEAIELELEAHQLLKESKSRG